MDTSPPTANLFAHAPPPATGERFDVLCRSGGVRIERIVSSAVPEPGVYVQTEHEWVVVIQGEARLRFDEEAVELKRGDFLHIAARRKHRVEWTTPDEPTIWLAIFYEPIGN